MQFSSEKILSTAALEHITRAVEAFDASWSVIPDPSAPKN